MKTNLTILGLLLATIGGLPEPEPKGTLRKKEKKLCLNCSKVQPLFVSPDQLKSPQKLKAQKLSTCYRTSLGRVWG